MVAAGTTLGTALTTGAASEAAAVDNTYPYPNAPDCNEATGDLLTCRSDLWSFYQGQCTSYVAWKLNERNVHFNNSYGGVHWGDASNWGAAARSVGIAVDSTPAVGSVAWYSYGHVAYVDQVLADGSVVMSDMNADLHNGFRGSVAAHRGGAGWPTGFIHVSDGGGGGGSQPSEGSFVVPPSGQVFRIAGGAPIYVSDWNAVGGVQPTIGVSQAQFDALNPFPADGSFLAAGGSIYRVAGGAPLPVTTCNHFGGTCAGYVTVDAWSIAHPEAPEAHLRAVPADGTFLAADGGGIYRVAGGAPLPVTTCNHFGGTCAGYVTVDPFPIAHAGEADTHLRAVPADGTFLAADGGGIYRVAGGAPLPVTTCNHFGGTCAGYVTVDPFPIAHAGETDTHLRAVPADGTFLAADGGGIYRVAGGAPLPVTTCNHFGGTCAGYVTVDPFPIAHAGEADTHLRAVPADGTFLAADGVGMFRVAGGKPFPLSTCSTLSDCPGNVTVDPFPIAHAGEPDTHLRSTPLDGTVVTTRPTNGNWVYQGGCRTVAPPPVVNDVALNDDSVTGADLCPSGVAGTVTETGSGDPLTGVWVAVLRTSDFSIAGGAVSDGSGAFAAEVPVGSYYLYLVDPAGTHTAGFHGQPATVTVATATMVDADPAMAPLRGQVTATVTEAGSGTPISGVWGLALSAARANTGAVEQIATGDETGHVTVVGLRPGSHFFGYVDPTGAHATRFYPNSPDVPGSTPVAVTAATTTSANATLPIQTPVGTGATISGTITEQGTGVPVTTARVVALRASDYRMVRGTTTDTSGHYDLDLAAGGYKLAVIDATGTHNMEWYNNRSSTDLASAMTVNAPGTADAALDANTGPMTGTITDDPSGDPIDGAWVIAIGPTGIAGGAITATDGTYTISGLAPGTYRATFVDPNGGRTQEYFDDSPDYAGAATINITAANTTTVNADLALP